MINLHTKNILSNLILSTLLFSCAPDTQSNLDNIDDSDSIGSITCDSLLSTAIELIRIDPSEIGLPPDYEKGSGAYTKRFYFYRFMNKDTSKGPKPFLDEYHPYLSLNSIWESKRLDTIFSIDDTANYHDSDLKIETECYTDYNFISRDSVKNWIELYKQDKAEKSPKYFSVSKPLLSKNAKYLLLEFDDNCYNLCGTGNTYLFVFKDGRWRKVWDFCRWIS